MPTKCGALTLDDKLTLIMTCLKYNANKLNIDFDKVRDDINNCETKTAAYWRHVRLMKEYGMTVSGELLAEGKGSRGRSKAASQSASPSKRSKATTNGTTTKKRAPATKKRARNQEASENEEDGPSKQLRLETEAEANGTEDVGENISTNDTVIKDEDVEDEDVEGENGSLNDTVIKDEDVEDENGNLNDAVIKDEDLANDNFELFQGISAGVYGEYDDDELG